MRIEFKDMARVVGETWRTLTPKERSPYETVARQESMCYEKEKRVHEEKHRHYTSLYHKAAAAGRQPTSLLLPMLGTWHAVSSQYSQFVLS